MKKKLIALIAAVTLIFAFTGCGTGPEKAEKDKTATAKSEQAKAEKDAEKAKAEAEKAKAEAEKAKAEAEKAKAKSEKAKIKTAKDIGVDKATKIALKDAGLSKGDVKFTKQSPGEDDGVRIYEIEFTAGDTEYEYNIDAATGKILERDSENDYDGD